MFPTASSQIDYNEDGEVLGWDSGYGFEPEFDSADMYEDHDYIGRDCEHNDYEYDAEGHAICDTCGELLPDSDI